MDYTYINKLYTFFSPKRSATPVKQSKAIPAATNNTLPTTNAANTISNAGSGILGGLMQGMVWGTGSAIGHRVVDGVMGPRKLEVEHTNSNDTQNTSNVDTMSTQQTMDRSGACQFEKDEFRRCVDTNSGNLDFCRPYFDALSRCQRI